MVTSITQRIKESYRPRLVTGNFGRSVHVPKALSGKSTLWDTGTTGAALTTGTRVLAGGIGRHGLIHPLFCGALEIPASDSFCHGCALSVALYDNLLHMEEITDAKRNSERVVKALDPRCQRASKPGSKEEKTRK